MLIKSVTKEGTAVPLSPQEALKPAIAMGLSLKNDAEFVFWSTSKPVASSFSSHPQDGGGYEAFAEGTCLVGKTRVKDDKFFTEKPYSFKIHYASSKDEIGAPHIVVKSFDIEPASTNMSSGPTPNQTVGVMAADMFSEKSSGGKISTKYAKR